MSESTSKSRRKTWDTAPFDLKSKVRESESEIKQSRQSPPPRDDDLKSSQAVGESSAKTTKRAFLKRGSSQKYDPAQARKDPSKSATKKFKYYTDNFSTAHVEESNDKVVQEKRLDVGSNERKAQAKSADKHPAQNT